jgi:hypothetical protein
MTAFFIFFIGCFFKTYSLNGQLRDSNGRPVQNAIVKVDASQVETRSDKKGSFKLEIKYKKKNAPYMLDVIPLAHKQKTLELFLGDEKDKEIKRKMVLEPKVIHLPYRKLNMDLENGNPLHPPVSKTKEDEEAQEATEEQPKDSEETEDSEEDSEETNESAASPPQDPVPPAIPTEEAKNTLNKE